MFLVEPILFSYYKRKSKLLRFHKRKFSTALIIDHQLSRKKIRQKFSVIKTNTSDDIKINSSFLHFNSRFVLKTKKPQMFVMITKHFWHIFWRTYFLTTSIWRLNQLISLYSAFEFLLFSWFFLSLSSLFLFLFSTAQFIIKLFLE